MNHRGNLGPFHEESSHPHLSSAATHDHVHAASSVAAERNRRPLWIALAITGGFFVVEVVGGLITGSLALLADAGHMLSDVAALALALFAFWISARPATPERTYGYYRVEVLAATANAVTLVALALYIFWEAYHRLLDPPTVQSLPMLAVATVGLMANGASALILSRGAEDNLNLRGAFLHVLGDLLGSVGAIVAGLVMLLTGWYYADPLVSVIIGVLVLYSGWWLLRESVDILLEATPASVDLREIERALLGLPEVAGVHDLHVWTVTSGFLAMSGHLTLRNSHDDHTLATATDLLRSRFGIGHVTLQLESAAEESQIHHGCYIGPDTTGCVVPPFRRPSVPHHHHH